MSLNMPLSDPQNPVGAHRRKKRFPQLPTFSHLKDAGWPAVGTHVKRRGLRHCRSLAAQRAPCPTGGLQGLEGGLKGGFKGGLKGGFKGGFKGGLKGA